YPDADDRVVLFERLERELTAMPGVEHAAIATSLPIYGYNSVRSVFSENLDPSHAALLPEAFNVSVSSSYFDTLGIPLVSGRLFPPDIARDDPAVVIVNASLAERFWPGENPI